MRIIEAGVITRAVKDLYLDLSFNIGCDVTAALEAGLEKEASPTGKEIICQILENNRIAKNEKLAICQDTGMAVLFIALGQDVHISGGDFNEAVQMGVREAYAEGYLRKSIVSDPLFDRKNTGDNTPAIIHLSLVPGEKIGIQALAKGFGSENMSGIKMLAPADGEEGVLDFIRETVRRAGPNPCPPVVIGVGIGGTMEKATEIAKRATIRPVGSAHPDPRYAKLEKAALDEINALGIGPGGLGGRVTALCVNIETFPTHIAGMPVAVNVCCHAARHGEVVL